MDRYIIGFMDALAMAENLLRFRTPDAADYLRDYASGKVIVDGKTALKIAKDNAEATAIPMPPPRPPLILDAHEHI